MAWDPWAMVSTGGAPVPTDKMLRSRMDNAQQVHGMLAGDRGADRNGMPEAGEDRDTGGGGKTRQADCHGEYIYNFF